MIDMEEDTRPDLASLERYQEILSSVQGLKVTLRSYRNKLAYHNKLEKGSDDPAGRPLRILITDVEAIEAKVNYYLNPDCPP